MVNLLVTPEQAEALSLASNQTKIQLVLRNPLDTKFAKTTGTDMAQLFGAGNIPVGLPRPARIMHRAHNPAPRVYLIEVFNGSKRTEAKFASHEGKK